jgi:hypothetical protein
MIVPCFAIASYTFSKISMVLFCLILLGPLTTKRQIWFIVCGGLPLVMMNLAMIIGTAMYCKPREKMWRPYLPGTCLPRSIISLGAKIDFGENSRISNSFEYTIDIIEQHGMV